MKTPQELVEKTKQELDKYGLKPYENVEVKDPFTGEKKMISLDRTGHNETKLITVLADPEKSRDQKDHALSMYAFERGAQNISMLVDLYRYKGEHTKQTELFKSRMRLDFETFVNSFTRYLQNQSILLGITLGINIEKEKEAFEKWLKTGDNKKKGYTYIDFYSLHKPITDKTKIALIEMAIYAQDESDALIKGIQDIVQARMAMKGGGIYIDKNMQPFSVNDPALDEIIKKEREMEKEAEDEIRI